MKLILLKNIIKLFLLKNITINLFYNLLLILGYKSFLIFDK